MQRRFAVSRHPVKDFLIGFNPGPGYSYFPSVPEIMITLGIIAIEILGYIYFVKKLPVMPRVGQVQPSADMD